jgi:hypothetical protein
LSRPERTSSANLRIEAFIELTDVIDDLFLVVNLLERAGERKLAADFAVKAHELETLKKRITP